MKIIKHFVIVFLVTASCYAGASDLAKEKRWADQVVDAIIDGDAVWLNDGVSDFLSIYTEAAEDKGRAVIVMHGTGAHPDWQQVVQPLRVGLTEHNWNTLSIQLPVLANDVDHLEYAVLYGEIAPRINAALKYLAENGVKKVVLIGHSQGSIMAAYYLSTVKHDVQGFVAIGMSSYAEHSQMNSIESLEKIKLPVLDLYGSDDLDSVRSIISLRAGAAKKAANKSFTQLELPGNHFFDGKEDALVQAVASWLEKLDGREAALNQG
ncbi:MAG: alpha/beta hydrolase family protein [Gammaproteobacteria bacterium]|nr:alpha/beta hydrolase family protein [Gammaproteobacteria bacterium]